MPPRKKARRAPAASRALPWLSIVELCRAEIDTHRWRLSVLRSLPRWAEFATIFSTCGTELRSYGLSSETDCPEAIERLDDRLAWAWGAVDECVDAVLFAMDQRSTFSQHDLASYFSVMQGAGLILPDGTIQKHVQDRIEREELSHDASESARLFTANAVTAERQAELRAIQAKSTRVK